MITLIAFCALAFQDPAEETDRKRILEERKRLLDKKRPVEGEQAEPPRPGRPLIEEERVLLEKIQQTANGSEEQRKLLTELQALRARVEEDRRKRGGETVQEVPRPAQPPRPGQPSRPGEALPMPRPVENPDEVRAWLKENEPETYKRMMEAQEAGRRPDVMRMLSEAEPRMRQLEEMKERDPRGFERMKEMRALEGESVELGERSRRAAPDERERIAKRLAEVLGKLFDLREENRAREVGELKKRLEALEKELANRKGNKEKIVEQRRRELLGAKGDLDW